MTPASVESRLNRKESERLEALGFGVPAAQASNGEEGEAPYCRIVEPMEADGGALK